MPTEAAKPAKYIDIPGIKKEIQELLDSNPSTDEIDKFYNKHGDVLMLVILQHIQNHIEK